MQTHTTDDGIVIEPLRLSTQDIDSSFEGSETGDVVEPGVDVKVNMTQDVSHENQFCALLVNFEHWYLN
jgi:hypothetical protein